jgi:hypothetical protein
MRPKPTHVYGWDEEPADERPSEFMSSSGYSVLSGYHTPHDLSARMSRRRKGSGLGFAGLLVALVVLLVLSAYAMNEFGRLIHL